MWVINHNGDGDGADGVIRKPVDLSGLGGWPKSFSALFAEV